MKIVIKNLAAAEKHVTDKGNGAHDIVGFVFEIDAVYEDIDTESTGTALDKIREAVEQTQLFDDFDEYLFRFEYKDFVLPEDETQLEIVKQEFSFEITEFFN